MDLFLEKHAHKWDKIILTFLPSSRNREVIKDYDFEYFLTQKKADDAEEDTTFVIVGTKHVDNDYISWTKN